MPELPEVETIKRDLEKLLIGQTVQSVEIRDPTILTGFLPNGGPRRNVLPHDFEKNVIGKQICNILRRCKYLIIKFTDQSCLILHLRMTGRLTVQIPSGSERMVLRMLNGTQLCFTDTRRFGEVLFSKDWKSDPCLKTLGIEPLSADLKADLLMKKFGFVGDDEI